MANRLQDLENVNEAQSIQIASLEATVEEMQRQLAQITRVLHDRNC